MNIQKAKTIITEVLTPHICDNCDMYMSTTCASCNPELVAQEWADEIAEKLLIEERLNDFNLRM